MTRLTGMDAGFLYQELPLQPMTAVVLALLRCPEGSAGEQQPVTPAEVRDHVERRLEELAFLRWKVVPVPFGLHHPIVVDDPDFDLDAHLHHIVLGPGSGPDALDRLVCVAQGQRLDRRRPLWHLTLVDGLADGRQGILLTIHHALVDGAALLTTCSRLFSREDHGVAGEHVATTAVPAPTRGRLVGDALRDRARAAPTVVRLVRETRRGSRNLARHREAARTRALKPFADTEPCSLNTAFTRDRVISRTLVPMDDVLRIKAVAGVTVNDVVLGITAGALRRFLGDRADLPERSLTASVPVVLDPPDAAVRRFGNNFSGMTVSLATDVADPWERLRVIAELSRAAKVELDIGGRDILPRWLEVLPPVLVRSFVRLVHWIRPRFPNRPEMVNVLVSNVRGPATPWALGRATLDEVYFSGPPSNGTGAILIASSYAGAMSLLVTAFADSVEDPAALRRHLTESFDELAAAATREAEAASSQGTGPDRVAAGGSSLGSRP